MRCAVVLLAIVISACTRMPPPDPPVAQPATAVTAAVPDTDIWSAILTATGELMAQAAPWAMVQRPGYDNQPAWLGAGRGILYTSIRSDGQADIYQFSLETGATRRLTSTPESEYSPTPTPDGRHFSVVRVELDSTQRLWRFPIGGGEPSLILPEVKPVGYHAWLDSTTLALFVLGSPNTLQIADTRTGSSAIVTTNIGRSLQRVPGSRRASFVKRADGRMRLFTVDATPRQGGTFEVDTVATLPEGAEYVVWLSPTLIVTGAGTKLYRMERQSGPWREIADFSSAGLRNISRLVVDDPSGDMPQGGQFRRLAIVAEPVR